MGRIDVKKLLIDCKKIYILLWFKFDFNVGFLACFTTVLSILIHYPVV